MAKTFTTMDRQRFAAILRLVRADRTLRSYGRLMPFGRVIIADQFRVYYPAWTSQPAVNIHR